MSGIKSDRDNPGVYKCRIRLVPLIVLYRILSLQGSVFNFVRINLGMILHYVYGEFLNFCTTKQKFLRYFTLLGRCSVPI